MKIVYTNHLEFRLKIRQIPYGLPEKIFRLSKEHYFDKLTNYYIAIQSVKFKGKMKEMAVTYHKTKAAIKIITVHPLKPYQKYSRIKSGRWKKL